MALPEPGLSLYVHVPFCTDKCLYCDFFSVPRHTVDSPLIARTVREAAMQARQMVDAAGAGARVETIFVGGGTPSCLPPKLLRELLGAFSDLRPAEWTVESNPETLTAAFLDECARAGVNRLSLGIQSTRTEHLATLRRRATREHGLMALDLLRKGWRGELNLDFITGIPGQTMNDVTEDMALLEQARPGHVSLYQLTVEPGTPLEAEVHAGRIVLNDPSVDEDLWLAGKEALVVRGYRQYEVSNFALAGKECRHNLRYWHIQPYAGAGPGAVSTLPPAWAARAAGRPDLAEFPGVIRFTVPKSIPTFVRGRGHFWGIETEAVSPRDFLLESLMMGLRLAEGIPRQTVERRFGRSFDALFPGLWDGWIAQGHARADNESLLLSSSGMMILDHLLEELMERLPEGDRAPSAVNWP